MDKKPMVAGHLTGLFEGVKGHAQHVYQQITRPLQDWLKSKGVDSAAARKQARGAARGCLGNALYTEMIFSASVSQWRNMLKQRCAKHADAEIRGVYVLALEQLKSSHYEEAFRDFELEACSDGIGEGLKG